MPAPARRPARPLWYVGHRQFFAGLFLQPSKSRGNPHLGSRHHPRFPQHFSQWSQWSQLSATASPKECAIVRAVDASTINGLHNAERGPRCQPKSKLRPMAESRRDASRPVPGVDGRGPDAWAPIFFQTNRRANHSLHRFALDGESARRPDGGFPPSLERLFPRGPIDPNPWRRRFSARPENPPADRRSRRVQASPTYFPSVRPFGHRSTAFCCTFCCTFCCIKAGPKTATKRSNASPSTTSTEIALQQQSTARTAKITGPVATRSRPCRLEG
jgi:hypothetical protein